MALLRARPDLIIEEMEDLEPATFVRRLPEADALLIRTAMLPREALVRADRLKVVSRHGVGYDNLPVDALTAKGVPLAIVGGVHADCVAEHAFFLMLALAKNALPYDRAVRTRRLGRAQPLAGFELSGRTLLLIGFGRIGRRWRAARSPLACACSPTIPSLGDAEIAAAGAAKVPTTGAPPSAKPTSISLHLPRLPETENMIGAAELAADEARRAHRQHLAGRHRRRARACRRACRRDGSRGAGIDVFDESRRQGPPALCVRSRAPQPAHCRLDPRIRRPPCRPAAENVLAALDGRLDPALVVNKRCSQAHEEEASASVSSAAASWGGAMPTPFAPRRASSTCRSRRCWNFSPTSTTRSPTRPPKPSASPARPATGRRWSPIPPSISSTSPTPNALHKPIALAAIAAGKPVYCEKPLAPNAAEAKEMADAAEKAGVEDRRRLQLSQEPDGRAGPRNRRERRDRRGRGFRGIHAEDYMTDASAPFTWRLDPKGGHGVVADLGSHIISIARFVVGPIAALVGQIETVVKERPVAPGAKRDAQGRGRRPGARAGALRQRRHRLARGELGQCRPQDDARLRGDRLEGLDRRRPRAPQRACSSTPPASRPAAQGFKTILAGPDHANSTGSSARRPATSSASTTSRRSRSGRSSPRSPAARRSMPDFREAYEIQRVVDAIVQSARGTAVAGGDEV